MADANQCEAGLTSQNPFDAPALSDASLCGFSFIPNFKFPIGYKLPAIPNISYQAFLPSLALTCDINKPFAVGWGGGRVAVYSPCMDEENQQD